MTTPILQPPGDFAPQTVDKVERLLGLLGEINDHRYLGPRLVLHGGTALNVFHLDIPRLSVDIDVLYVGAVSRDTMLAERPEICGELETLAYKLGYRHNAPPEEYAGVTYKFVYRTRWGEDMIKVDLNFLNRSPILGHEMTPCRHCIPEVQFRVVPYAELIAGKIKALVERRSAATRDLYDLYRASQVDFDDWALLQSIVVHYWTLADTFPRSLDGSMVERFLGQERGLESDLFPVLLPAERPKLGEMVEAVALFLERLGALSPEQRKYMDLMAESGEYRPELVFSPWPEVLERAKSSPAAAWKVHNLQKRGHRH
ncbi:MAG: nucleotidyl transferase AbiEii/AbiGii toxin family protein [Actinobacteria bacterium]|nr:nucleotidyl transferase AbiEii/AbiGii toxin family protein [Actinomycetota bacterium]